jgi:hypothetical protein
MMAGGALYVRHPARRAVTAVRVASAGGYRPAPTGPRSPNPGDALAPVASVSVYDLVSDLRRGANPSRPVPATTIAGGRAPAPLAPPATLVPGASPAPLAAPAPASSAPASSVPVTSTPSTTPLAPLLQTIVPTAAAVLGVASWFDAPAGTCAHRDLPLGTIVKVTRTSTGASTTCRVADRGPSLATNRVIDLSQDTFQKLASTDAGLIEVKIEW